MAHPPGPRLHLGQLLANPVGGGPPLAAATRDGSARVQDVIGHCCQTGIDSRKLIRRQIAQSTPRILTGAHHMARHLMRLAKGRALRGKPIGDLGR
jgi:hypothetical protein